MTACESKSLLPHTATLVNTGIAVQIPMGCYGRIAPRSGFSYKNNVNVGAGVIDRDYRGPLKVLLLNQSYKTVEVESGMRVAQLILERAATPEVVPVSYETLTATERGTGGFGSTGSTANTSMNQ